MQRPKIKAGHLTNLTDARYYAAQDVDWIGFHVDPTEESALSIHELFAIKGWIEGPAVIAEVGFINVETARSLEELAGIDGLQVSGYAELPPAKNVEGFQIIRELVVQPDATLSLSLDGLSDDEILLLDFERNEVSAEKLDLSTGEYIEKIRELTRGRDKFIVHLPYGGEKLIELVKELQPYGLELKGSEEEKVGFKSFEEIDAFFEYWEAD